MDGLLSDLVGTMPTTKSIPVSSAVATAADATLFVLVSKTAEMKQADLLGTLATQPVFQDSPNGPSVHVISVPQLAPVSDEQAREQSIKYWPTVYRSGNPYGPHPSIVARAEAEVRPEAGYWMALAQEAAGQVSDRGDGEAIGAVVVDRSVSAHGSLVVVAGDARWCNPFTGVATTTTTTTTMTTAINGTSDPSKGNAINHAAMRAIGMVARRRRDRLDHLPRKSSSPRHHGHDDPGRGTGLYLDRPITPFEEAAFAEDVLAPKGYLCVSLEIYMTHEPCIMCSMAMLHSRFERVVVGHPMRRTGGLMAETIFQPMVQNGHLARLVVSPSSGEDQPEVRNEKGGPVDGHSSMTRPPVVGAGHEYETPSLQSQVTSTDVAHHDDDDDDDDDDEKGLGYGLFWRAELNWRFLVWRWLDAEPASLDRIDENTNV